MIQSPWLQARKGDGCMGLALAMTPAPSCFLVLKKKWCLGYTPYLSYLGVFFFGIIGIGN